jgi:tRNA-splicing ligase RtcB (3'-phosphate/5'-hydroxy nucleic acid ligase)
LVILKGKYALARVMLDEADLDQGVRDQIMTFLNHPAFKGSTPVVMPDCHVGTDSVIGFTMPVNDYIIPNIVSVDIGCGVIAYFMGMKRNQLDRDDFDRMVRANVPLGFKRNVNTKHTEKYFQPVYFELAKKIGMEELVLTHSIGTLGGGNHFIEIDVDDNDNAWLLIHSGSRNFGKRVAEYWQNIAKELCAKFFVDNPKDLDFLPMSMGGINYLTDMMVAQQYAIANRLAMMEAILGEGFKPVPNVNFISSVHNYISAEDSIIRKGAISAREGEKCIIPFNNKDGVAICTGKGNKKYNFSAPHGAGRNFGRKEMYRKLAAGEISVKQYQQGMEDAGVFMTTANKETIDEMWIAYKDKDLIIRNIADTVSIDFFMKPIWCLKAGEKEK